MLEHILAEGRRLAAESSSAAVVAWPPSRAAITERFAKGAYETLSLQIAHLYLADRNGLCLAVRFAMVSSLARLSDVPSGRSAASLASVLVLVNLPVLLVGWSQMPLFLVFIGPPTPPAASALVLVLQNLIFSGLIALILLKPEAKAPE